MDMGSCSSRDIFALQVTDDTMEPEFMQGKVIIVDPEGHVRDQCFVLASVDKEWFFRQLRIVDGKYELHALKEGSDVHTISGLKEIEGVVIQQTGRRRKDRKFYPPRDTE